MATKITTGLIDSGAITSALIGDASITADDLHTTLDLTGKTVTVATATAGDNDTTVASTAFVSTAIANLADSAPSTLDTLNELAAALGDDANFSTTVTNSIALKAPLAGPTFTGDVDIDGSDDLRLRFLNGSTFKGGIQVPTSTGDMISGAAVDDLAIRSQANMLFSTGGNTERMRIDSSGNVAIGHTTTTGSKFAICDGANSQIQFFPEISTDTNLTQHYDPTAAVYINSETRAASHAWKIGTSESMRISSSGLIGIGSQPSNLTSEIVTISTPASGGGQGIAFKRLDSNNDQVVGQIRFSNNSTDDLAFIKVKTDGATTSSAMQFFTNTGSSSEERLRINSSGNVGIGTSSPAAVLNISKDVGNAEVEVLRLSNSDPDMPNYQYNHAVALGFELAAYDGGDRTSKLTAKIVGKKGANGGNDWYTGGASTNFQGQLDFYTRNDDVLTKQMTLDEHGFLGIGTSNPDAMLHVYSTTSGEAKLRLDISGTGSDVWDLYSTNAGRLYINAPAYGNGVYIQHSTTAWSANSDETLKENITSLGTVGDKLKNYRTSYFNWKSDTSETPRKQIGFIAQDWEDDFPEVVNKVEGEPLGMKYTETIPILLKYIQELEARITTLEG